MIPVLITPALGQGGADTLSGKVTNAVYESFFVNESFWLNCQNSAGLCFSRVQELGRVELSSGLERGHYHSVFQPRAGRFYGFASKGIKAMGKFKFIGSFEYNRRMNESVAWSQMVDAERPGPLVLADSVGGDWIKDKYNLSVKAGTDTLLGWLRLGLGLGYAVEHSARDNDPRPKCLAKDLSVAPSVMVELLPRHIVGASYSVRTYRQDVDVVNVSGVGSATLFKIYGLTLLEAPKVYSTADYRIDRLDQAVDLQYDFRMSSWNTFINASYGLISEKDIHDPYAYLVDREHNVHLDPTHDAEFAELHYRVAWGAELFTPWAAHNFRLAYGYLDAKAYSYVSGQVDYRRATRQVDLSLSSLMNRVNPSKSMSLRLGVKYSAQDAEQAFYASKQLDILNLALRAEKAFALLGNQSAAGLGLEWNSVLNSNLSIAPQSVFIPAENPITHPVVYGVYHYESSSWAAANFSWNLYFKSSTRSVKPYIGLSLWGLKVLNSEAFSGGHRVVSTLKFGLQL